MITDDHKAVAAAAKANKSGSDLDILQPRPRPIRRLPTTPANKPSLKHSKKKSLNFTSGTSAPPPTPLPQAGSDWPGLEDQCPHPGDHAPRIVSQSKRKAPNDIINQRTHNGRRTSTTRFAASTTTIPSPQTIPDLTSSSTISPVSTHQVDSIGLASHTFDIAPHLVNLSDGRAESKSLPITPRFPPLHHHRPRTLAPSLQSDLCRRRPSSHLLHHNSREALNGYPDAVPSPFAEHIDRSLCQPVVPINYADPSALAAALDALIPPTLELSHPRPLTSHHSDPSFCSFNASGAELTASSTSSPDRIFGSSFESRTNTPPPSRSPETSPDPSSSSEPAQFCPSGRTSPISFITSAQPTQYGSASLDATTTDGLLSANRATGPTHNITSSSTASPISMLGNVFNHWNLLSSFLPLSSTTLDPQASPSSRAEALNEIRPRSRNGASNIHPILNQSSVQEAHPPSPPRPQIKKLVPNEGPVYGGIEITILGEGFSPELELEFGGTHGSSVRTQFWSANTLVCILPPATRPGSCSVRMVGVVNERQEGTSEGEGRREDPLFTYVENTDQKLMELALQVVGLKMTGQIQDAKRFARQIIVDTSDLTLLDLARTGQATERANMQASDQTSDVFGLEVLVMGVLSFINRADDQIDPCELAFWVERSRTGQTLLHLAVWLGLIRLTEFILSFGRQVRKELVDARDANGCTALHFACWRSDARMVQMLLEAGARTYVRAGGMGDRTGLEIVRSSMATDHVRNSLVALFDEQHRSRNLIKMVRKTQDRLSRIEASQARQDCESAESGAEEEWATKSTEAEAEEVDQDDSRGLQGTLREVKKSEPNFDRASIHWSTDPITEADLEPLLQLDISSWTTPPAGPHTQPVDQRTLVGDGYHSWKKMVKLDQPLDKLRLMVNFVRDPRRGLMGGREEASKVADMESSRTPMDSHLGRDEGQDRFVDLIGGSSSSSGGGSTDRTSKRVRNRLRRRWQNDKVSLRHV